MQRRTYGLLRTSSSTNVRCSPSPSPAALCAQMPLTRPPCKSVLAGAGPVHVRIHAPCVPRVGAPPTNCTSPLSSVHTLFCRSASTSCARAASASRATGPPTAPPHPCQPGPQGGHGSIWPATYCHCRPRHVHALARHPPLARGAETAGSSWQSAEVVPLPVTTMEKDIYVLVMDGTRRDDGGAGGGWWPAGCGWLTAAAGCCVMGPCLPRGGASRRRSSVKVGCTRELGSDCGPDGASAYSMAMPGVKRAIMGEGPNPDLECLRTQRTSHVITKHASTD